MWKPGKWVYVDEEPNESTQTDNHHHIENSDPPSPPWKLGQVPVETAIFKDGRRMSRRFNPSIKANNTTATTPPPQSAMPKKPRRKSAGQFNSGSTQSASDQSSKFRRKSHAPMKDDQSPSTVKNDSLQPAQIESHPQASDPSKSPSPHDSNIHEASNQERNKSATAPASPNTTTPQNVLPHQDHQPQAHLDNPLKEQSKSRTSLPETEDLPPSIPDFNSVTDAHSAEPLTPPAIEYSSASISDRRASAPPSADLQLPPPLKKFKPWEALKSFQTDGADVGRPSEKAPD